MDMITAGCLSVELLIIAALIVWNLRLEWRDRQDELRHRQILNRIRR